jgi:hypothetical protein
MQKAAHFDIILFLVLFGCSIGEFFDYDQWPTIEEYQAGYSTFGNPWVGHKIDELLEERGRPDSVLEAKPRWSSFKNGVHVLSYIYYSEATAGVLCIEAFVVVEDTGTIIKYYCR